ncbi:MAG: hypothetical protein WBA10_11085, partial [Elainellaceae cyanobacterium]
MSANTDPKFTPSPIDNRPGLSAIAYRVGDFTSVKQRLLDLLPLILRQPTAPGPLERLTTRAEDDPAIALLDAWAVVADVITFYQERIANEGFLRTAMERRSVLELVRAIHYELDPGVAASAYLTVTVEEAPGSPDVVTVPARTQVLSVPIEDELPQTFETGEVFVARREWNAIRPRAARPQRITPQTQQLYLAGASTQLKAGDFLLLVDEPTSSTHLLRLADVAPNPKAGYTLVRWSDPTPAIASPLRNPTVFAFRQRAALFGSNAPSFAQMPAEVKLVALAEAGAPIRGGVVRSENNGEVWEAAGKGLPDSDILCLAARGTMLFAGTPDKGIFRSVDNGATWAAVNEGLTSQNVLALHIADSDTIFNGALFAGTPNGGVFRSKDNGANWVPINQGSVRVVRDESDEDILQPENTSLPSTVVRSLLTYSSLDEAAAGSGTIFSQGIQVTGFETQFTRELVVGDEIAVVVDGSRQTHEVTQIISDVSLEIDAPFTSQNLNHGTQHFDNATVTGTFVPAPGIITSTGNQVIGSGTSFLSRFSGGSRTFRIQALGQVKRVVSVASNTQLTIDSPFTKSSLPPSTAYELATPKSREHLFVGSDDGLYRSLNHGKDWAAANLTSLVVNALVFDEQILAGTDQGIYLSSDNGVSWNKIANGDDTPDGPVSAIAVFNNF